MTNATQDPIFTGGGASRRPIYSLEVETELEESDRKAGHEYVPMDVFVDPRTMKQHFQMSSIRARWNEFQRGEA